MTQKFMLTAALLALTASAAQAQTARDTISIVGSSTVYPFTTMVAEQLGRQGKFKTPEGREHRHRRWHQAVLQWRRRAVPGRG